MLQKKLVCIVGPTAIGKTAVAIELAKFLNTEIVSADSRQIFKEMQIGTAVPSAAELAAIKHHFIQSHRVTENYNAGKYEAEAIQLLDELFKKHDTLVMVGGSGLYIDAVSKGFDKLPSVEEKTRNELIELYAKKGIDALHELLKQHDKDYYNEVDLNNPHRIMRALEVCLTTNMPYSALRTKTDKKRSFKTIFIGLNTERDILYKRINNRVDEMMENGLLAEVKSLLHLKDCNALQTVGYKELFEHLGGKTNLQDAITKIKQNTRNFAKRQITWFNKNNTTQWFAPNEIENIIKAAAAN
jgi:tRNA dimethylallyltransferase